MTTTSAPPTLDVNDLQLPTTFYDNRVVHTVGGQDIVWRPLRILGQGGQGTVTLEKRDIPNASGDPEWRAVKRLPQKQLAAKSIDVKREIRAMMAVREHDNFVRLLGWYESQPRSDIYLAMEYVPYGDLSQYISLHQTLASYRSSEIAKQILTGISILHRKHICHRDLKPQNVLISSLAPFRIKLADFGLSKSFVGTDLRTRLGTTNYMAPELFGLLPPELRPGQGYSTAVDMWALGCLVHAMLTGETPFVERLAAEDLFSGLSSTNNDQSTDMFLLAEFCKGNVGFPTQALESCKSTGSAIRFVRRLLVADPKRRVSADAALMDVWIAGDAGNLGGGTISSSATPLRSSSTATALALGVPHRHTPFTAVQSRTGWSPSAPPPIHGGSPDTMPGLYQREQGNVPYTFRPREWHSGPYYPQTRTGDIQRDLATDTHDVNRVQYQPAPPHHGGTLNDFFDHQPDVRGEMDRMERFRYQLQPFVAASIQVSDEHMASSSEIPGLKDERFQQDDLWMKDWDSAMG